MNTTPKNELELLELNELLSLLMKDKKIDDFLMEGKMFLTEKQKEVPYFAEIFILIHMSTLLWAILKDRLPDGSPLREETIKAAALTATFAKTTIATYLAETQLIQPSVDTVQ